MATHIRKQRKPTPDIILDCRVTAFLGQTTVDHDSTSGVITEGTGEHSGSTIDVVVKDSPVKVLYFGGPCSIYSGDRIKAYFHQVIPLKPKPFKKRKLKDGVPQLSKKELDDLLNRSDDVSDDFESGIRTEQLSESVYPYKIEKMNGKTVLATYLNSTDVRYML